MGVGAEKYAMGSGVDVCGAVLLSSNDTLFSMRGVKFFRGGSRWVDIVFGRVSPRCKSFKSVEISGRGRWIGRHRYAGFFVVSLDLKWMHPNERKTGKLLMQPLREIQNEPKGKTYLGSLCTT